MIYGLFAIKDTKSEFFKPFTHFNEQTALREFGLMVNNKANAISDNPADYELWRVGQYDTTTGTIVPQTEFIVNAMSVKKVNE